MTVKQDNEWDIDQTRWYMYHFDSSVTAYTVLKWIMFIYVICLGLLCLMMVHNLPAVEPEVQKVEVLDKLPRMCDNLYNVGKHDEWATCMGVGKK